MKASLLGVGLLVLSGFAGSAARADEPIALAANRQVAVTAAGLYVDYHEFEPVIVGNELFDSGAYKDSQTGWSPGVNLTWSDVFDPRQGHPSLYVRASYQYYDWTITHHDYSNGAAVDPQAMPLKINDFSAELGVARMFDDERVLLAGFLQVEHFDWQRVLANSEMNYLEDYSFVAPGAGVRATIALSKHLALSGKLGFEYTGWPQVTGSGDAATLTPPTTFKLGPHFLGQGSVGLDYAVSRHVALKLGCDLSRFAFGHSALDVYFVNGRRRTMYEPTSVTNEAVTQLGVAWTY